MRNHWSEKFKGWTGGSRRGRTGQSPSPALMPPANSAQPNTLAPPQTHANSSTNSIVTHPGARASPVLTSGGPGFMLDPALRKAIEERVAQLSDNDRASFQTAGDIMYHISATDARHGQTSLSRDFGSRIERILQNVKGFVAVVGPCVPSSQIASIVVGGLNFVLSLVLGYIEFFDSLTAMMERIAEHLDYLTLYGSRVLQTSLIVQKALVQAYIDLVDFFVAVRDVFGNLDSRVKSFRLFLRLTWEPFNTKFQPVHDKFLAHTLIVVRAAGVENLVNTLEREQEEDSKKEAELRRKVLEWLTPVDYEETHQRHFKKHFGKTGQWLIDHQQFAAWKDTPGSRLLWCYGIPGSGKTVLASLVIEHLSQYELSDRTGFCFVYCNYKEPQDTTTYVRALMKQLQRSIDDIHPELATYFHNDRKPGYVELQLVLQQLSERFNNLFLVLDVLDECLPDQRREILEVLQGLVSPRTSHSCHVKLFITSREEPDIKRALTTFPMIKIEAQKINEDIEAYVSDQMGQYLAATDFTIEDTLRNKIRSTLVDKAGGMFLWVEFQLKHIFAQTSAGHIERALMSLPEDMDRTYDRIIDLITNSPKPWRELGRRALMWIAYAEQPLTVGDLTYDFAMEYNTRTVKELNSMIPTIGTIVDICSNLIVATSDDIRFVHFSIQEYILSKSRDPGNASITALGIRPDLAQLEISRMCVTFALYCWSPRDPMRQYPSFPYALCNWMVHVRAVNGINEDLLTLILKYFQFGAFSELDTLSPVLGLRRLPQPHTKFSPSTTALIFDLPLISDHLETKNGGHLDYRDEKYAIHFAARRNSPEAIERLCNRGFTVNDLDTDRLTAMYYATEIPAFRSLLYHGANVNAHNGHALANAVRSGWLDRVHFLLASGANPNLAAPLLAAAASSNMKLILAPLDAGADANTQLEVDGNPLQTAAAYRRAETAQLLIDRGANVNAQGGYYHTALQAAADTGWVIMVQLLLDHGSDVNAQGGKYHTALQAAACNGSVIVVQLLLDHGADVNAQGGYYHTALQGAAVKGSVIIVQLLLDHGADVNTQGGKFHTALQGAAVKGSMIIVQLLLDHGADVNAQGGKFHTALQAAAVANSEGLVQLLLGRGADVHARGGYYHTALQAAAVANSEGLVQLLLGRGADVHARGGYYETALQAAAANGMDSTLHLLLDHGANVNVQGVTMERHYRLRRPTGITIQ